MSIHDLVTQLNKKNIKLSLKGDELAVHGKRQALAPALVKSLRENKKALVDLIKSGEYAGPGETVIEIPPNLIPAGCRAITPRMLPLMELTQAEIDVIVSGTPGGAANIQDIYPLTTLQEGILFHHLMNIQGDAYLLPALLSFDTRERLEGLLVALREVIARHDTLRTAVVWEGLREPAQVVWREAELHVEEVTLDPAEGEAADQLYARVDPWHVRLDLRQAPLMRCWVAQDAARGRWLLLWLSHHIVSDHSALEMMIGEAQAILLGKRDRLPEPLPFRNLVAQARMGREKGEDEAFFREMLGDVYEPTTPYGLLEAQVDGVGIDESRMALERSLGLRVRERARALGVSAASLFHVACGRVLGLLSGREDVVFGTVLLGRMEGVEGAERALGLFINTLPIRVRVGKESVERCVRRTHELLGELMRHERAPLALAQRLSGVEAPRPLFNSLLNYRHGLSGGGQSPEMEVAWAGIEALRWEERTNYPLAIVVDDLGDAFTLMAQAMKPMEAPRICEYLKVALEQLVDALERAPETEVRALEALPEAERRQLLDEWNATEVEYPAAKGRQEKLAHELIEEQAERSPEAVALVYEGESLSYRELNARANQLAHYLRRLGVGPEARVGICVERSLEMVVGLLGILKAGGAYVPLDPAYPKARLLSMVEDSNPRVVLTRLESMRQLPEFNTPVVCLDRDWEKIGGLDAENPMSGVSGANVAYVIYTSGSTGRPKGAMNTHRGMGNRLRWMQQAYGLTEGDAVLQKTPFSFDVSVWEFFWPLMYGGRLVVARPGGHRDSRYLVKVIQEQHVSLMHFVPSMLAAFMADGSARQSGMLRKVFSSGEALGAELVKEWYRQRPDTELHNLYGPTEASVDVTSWKCERGEATEIAPIGKPIANTEVYVLNQRQQLAPVGVFGELYLGGWGLARGYLNRSALTAERFAPDPFSEVGGARLYRTGDETRWRSDGNLEFRGRLDQQVKLRGYRIELGEIEAVLNEHPSVRQSVVAAKEDGKGDRRLIGYVVGEGRAAPAELKRHVKERLPEYMVPQAILVLEEMPVTANGKIDRKRVSSLPLPSSLNETGDKARHEGADARTPVEEALAGIFEDVLKIDRVGAHDNFFEIGGHSLLATQAISRVRSVFGVEVEVGSLFESPTVEGLSRRIEKARRGGEKNEAPPLVRAPREGGLPLSFAQQRLWFIHQLEPDKSAYNMPSAVRLEGRLDVEALERVINEIVRRHEVLRTRIVVEAGEPVQVIDRWEPRRLERIDLTGLPREEREEEARKIAREEAGTGFDLSRGPLLRVKVLKLDEEEHVALFTMSHIAGDGWSNGILIREISALYRAYIAGEPSPLAELPIQYADFAVWQREWLKGEALERELGYWRKQLAGMEPLELPTDHARPAAQGYRGGSLQFVVERELAEKLRALSRREGVTLFMALLGAFQALMSRYSGQKDIVIGTDIANRNRAEIEGVIGFFVNQLVLRVEVRERERFRELLRRVREVCLRAYEHQDAPFEKLVEELQPERDLSRSPLFQVKLILQNAPGEGLELEGTKLSGADIKIWAAKFDLTVAMTDAGHELIGAVDYSLDLFERETIGRLIGHYKNLLSAVVEECDSPISQLDLLNDEEREQILVEWNRTGKFYPNNRYVHHLFAEQSERNPERIALIAGPEHVSYGELNRRANQLGRYLQRLGVGPEVVVGVYLARSVEMVVAVMGTLKAGGAYLPLDPECPLERLSFMLEDAGVGVALTSQELEARLPSTWLPTVSLDVEWRRIGEESESDPNDWFGNGPERGVEAENLAYVIYTSGSTGKPKGVMISHGGLVNYLMWATEAYRIAEGEGAPVSSSIGFDLTVTSLYGPLVNGRRVILTPEKDGVEALAGDLTRESGYSLVKITPTHLAVLAEQMKETDVIGRTRALVIGGEELKAGGLKRWQERARGTRLINEYGPTETVVGCCAYEVEEAESGRETVPIGRPIANTRMYALDRELEPVPVGVRGEIHIAGAGLARGYLRRPELTGERFIPDPFGQEGGERLYRTGDLGRYLKDGTLEFIGRADNQVKLRGYRIELGEIEAVLNEHPSVKQNVVMVREDGDGGKRLVGYVVGEEGASAAELKRHVRERVPAYMAPEEIRLLKALPMTPNGKVDRERLARMESVDRQVEEEYRAPRTLVEDIVGGIFEEVLRRGRVGRDDNFFEIGGHSLLATQVVSRIRDVFDVEIGVRSVFEKPTAAGLAADLEEARRAEERPVAPSLVRGERGGESGVRAPLSFAQQRLWFIDQLEPGNAAYNIPGALRLEGRLELEALEYALNEVVRRHEVLRTRIVVEAGEPVQVIDRWEPRRLERIDLTGLSREEREEEARKIAREEAGTGFDLSRGPLLRVKVLKLEEDEHVLLYTMHHIVSDGWSMGVLIREVGALYRACSEGAGSPLEELPIQYADYAVWQREYLERGVLEREVGYWKGRLEGAAIMELPADHARPAAPSYRGGSEKLELGVELSEELRRLSRREGATLFMALMAAFKALLMRYTGVEDVSVGTAIANRTRRGVEGLIGFFVNTLALRTDLTGNPSFKELIRREREVALGAYDHQEAPFEKLVEEINPQRDLGRSPFFQVMMTMQNAAQEAPHIGGLKISRIEGEAGTAKFDLTLSLTEGEGGLWGSLEYSRDLYEAETIRRMVKHLERVAREVARDAEQRIREVGLLSDAERKQVVMKWNETAVEYLRDRSIHGLFEEQVEEWPERVAVVYEGHGLSYGELNRRANQLAGRLRDLGVGLDARVAICMERSLEMVIGLLGILKAGGAYLPLDPACPRERLAFMIEDAQVITLLTQRRLAAGFAEMRERVVCLDAERDSIERQGRRNLLSGTTPDNLAYVMYTSGSTGTPKGVAVTHQNVMRLVNGSRFMNWNAREAFLQMAPVSFDASTFEIWGSLLNGARLILFHEQRPSLEELGRLIREQAVTVVWLTAGLFHQVAEAGFEGWEGVRRLLAGGDALSPSHVVTALEGLPECEVINGYGPTESTTFACCCPLREARGNEQRAPIGRPISNTKAYVLDWRRQPAPVGVFGELYLGGAGLARGYLGRPDLTAERFAPDPFSEVGGARLYQTGDETRWLPDGNLEFRGRLDRQVKLRGYRIELGEIEAVLSGHPGVRQAVVVAAADGRGEKRLVAYVVGDGEISATELRAYLQGRLPEYMTPGAWALLDKLPLTQNGKVDRKALPEPDVRVIDPESAAPRTAVEEILAGIFAQALNLERVGIEENFFDLGGHSLLATQVISRVKKAFDAELALRALFESPTVKGLARRVERALQEGRALAAAPLRRVDRSRDLPLSFAQQRLWLIHQMEPDSALYNMPKALRLEGEIDVAALERSLQEIVRRHEALRTSFCSEHGEPAQVINEDWRIALPVIDLSSMSADERLSFARRLAADEAERPFDLRCGCLLRVLLLRLDESDHTLIVNMHHIVSDEWSEGVFIGELAALYEAYGRGEQSPLPELEIQYADFSVWQREWLTGPVLERQRDYWKSRFGPDFQELQLPTDWPRPQVQTHNGEVCHFKFSASLSESIRKLCRAANSTLYMVLLAAFKTLLYRYTGQDVITVGSPIANRNRVEVEKLIGFFVNTLVLSSDVSDNPRFMELIDRVREATLDAYTYQDFPFDLLVEELRPKRRTNYSPLITVIFEVRNISGTNALKLPKLSLSVFYSRKQPAYFDLTLSLSESPDGIGGYFEYNTDLFSGDTIEEMKQRLESLLEAVTKDSGLRLLDIPLGPHEAIEGDQESLDPEIQGVGQDHFVFD